MAHRVSRHRAALAAVLVGLAVLGVGLLTWTAGMRTGANGFVNADRPSINAHNSPAVAVDPARPRMIAAANRIDTPEMSCAVARSTNGGTSWQPVELPLPPDAPNCYWPDVAFTDDGRLLVLYTATGGTYNRPLGVWLQAFTADGAPEGGPVPIAGEAAFHARIAAGDGRILVTWVQAGVASVDRPLGFAPEPNPIVVAGSTDGGRTFADPVAVSEAGRRVVQPSVVIGPHDRVLVGALDLGDDRVDYEALHDGRGGPPEDDRWRVVTWASTDGGSAFDSAVAAADELVIPERVIVEFAPTPGFAADPSTGRLYATWDAGRGDDRDVFLAWSDDHGATWSAPVGVAPRPRAQFLPAVAVAPDGRVDVVFYDRSGDPDDLLAEVVLASSRDRGASFDTLTISDRAFDSGIGVGSHQGIPVLSSQLAVAAQSRSSIAFWADTRNGDRTTNVQDLAVALVDHGRAWSPRWEAVGLGAAIIALGAAFLASGCQRRATR